jgi:protein YibB
MNQSVAESNLIGIVTAFFDIGRGGWTADKGLPGYLYRPTDAYFQRFSHLAALDNPMAIYTSPDLAPRIWDLRRGKEHRTRVIEVPFRDMFQEQRAAIARIQADPAFIEKVNPKEKNNPEYWSPDYILVNSLKSIYAVDAIENGLLGACDQIAWVDFGYCREAKALGGMRLWRYPFAPDKVHLFSYGPYLGNPSIPDIIYNNVLCVMGGVVIANRALWPQLGTLIDKAFNQLLDNRLVDDDQTLLLLATLYRPDLFELHTITESQVLQILQMFGTPDAA